MKCLDISVFLIVSTFFSASALKDASYCFKYTWRGSEFVYASKSEDCKDVKDAPCIDPVINYEPNTTKIWDSALRGDESKVCQVKPGVVCIKHTYFYDNAIVNTSSFCGKMIEDNKEAVTSGCYYQVVNGYTVESCACQSDRMEMPCNTSMKTEYSSLIMLIGFFLAVVNFFKH